MLSFLVLVFVCCSTFPKSLAWTGHVCTRQKIAYTYQRVCSYHCWWHCCGHKTIAHPYFVTEKYCCHGWTSDGSGSQNCNKPICSPPCQNGGTCDRPFHCQCRSGFKGATCDQVDKIAREASTIILSTTEAVTSSQTTTWITKKEPENQTANSYNKSTRKNRKRRFIQRKH